MKLYYFPGACSLATHVVLQWIGKPYETVRLDPASTKSPEFLALNPHGAVPLLVDDGFVLSQNIAILFYLAERFPEADLLGDDSPQGRAEILRWLGLLNSDVHPAFKPLFKPSLYLPDAAFASAIGDAARSNVRNYLEHLDARLQDRDWLVDKRSIADPYLFVMLRWTRKLNIDTSGLANLARFFSRMQADPDVQAVILAEEDRVDQDTRLGA
ncbi:MAG: glutathione S-transferase [Proteobacteria bacterium]|nr:MAG: glutathione S-transferase [Pseudomonadota bacterium]